MDHPLPVSLVNSYLAHKQRLLAASRLSDAVQVTRAIVALHATNAPGPYLSLWARTHDFRRDLLDSALYELRALARLICMRQTLHVLPSDELPFFFQAYRERYGPDTLKMCEELLLQAGLCRQEEAPQRLAALQQDVLAVLGRGAATVQEIGQALPALTAKVGYGAGKPYQGELTIGARLDPGMCALGLLARARPRGTWQSNLYEYSAFSAWLLDVDLASTTPPQARAWLIRRYLSAFGPATFRDMQWWTGFTKGETQEALTPMNPAVVEVTAESSNDTCVMLADDALRLQEFSAPRSPHAFLLPALDPYIMGYQDRRRFLAAQHNDKVFDRAGNAMPTVWLNGQVAGVWAQKAGGEVVWRLFEQVGMHEQALLAEEAARLESFLAGEVLAPRTQTAFYRTLG